MTSFSFFCDNSKMRYDFADQIQVRYHHLDGEDYDTWVSGEEVLQRLRSDAAEEKLRRLSNMELREVRTVKEQLPEIGKDKLADMLIDRLSNGVEDFIGGNIIGDNLADAVRGNRDTSNHETDEKSFWSTLLENDNFRSRVLELAWIQLEGSFPESDSPSEPDDWI